MGNKPYRARAVANHKARLVSANRPNDPKGHYPNVGEAEVVAGFQLSNVLREWTVQFLNGAVLAHGDVEGPVQWLADQTGINVRTVSRIINGGFITVPLTKADALLQAIERPDLLGTVVRVVPNPNWSLEKWVAYLQERGCRDGD